MEALGSSETAVNTNKTTERQNPEDHNPNFERLEKLKSHTVLCCFRQQVTSNECTVLP